MNREFPVVKGVLVWREVVGVADAPVSAERNVEFTLTVEPAKAIEARPRARPRRPLAGQRRSSPLA